MRNIFSYRDLASELTPFVLMDYAGPADFAPTDARRGVGAHPHRGFETVTIVYAGGVSHRDSGGGGGTIGPGDVQCCTSRATPSCSRRPRGCFWMPETIIRAGYRAWRLRA